jgi:hypothetical protein
MPLGSRIIKTEKGSFSIRWSAQKHQISFGNTMNEDGKRLVGLIISITEDGQTTVRELPAFLSEDDVHFVISSFDAIDDGVRFIISATDEELERYKIMSSLQGGNA